MPDIVGTAYITVRALTGSLASDIQDGLDKGTKDAKTDKSGKTLGEGLSKSTGDEIGKSSGKDISDGLEKGAKDADVEKSSKGLGGRIKAAFSGLFKGAGKDITEGLGDDISKNSTKEIEKGISDGAKNVNVDSAATGLSHRFASLFHKKLSTPRTEDQQDYDKFATNVADGIGRAFKGINIPGIPTVAVLAAPVVAGALQGLVSLLGGVVAQLGFVVTAALGAGAAMAGLGLSAGLAMIPIKLAMAALKDEDAVGAIKDLQNEAKDLAEQFKKVGVATATSMIPGMSAVLGAAKELVPTFVMFGTSVGNSVSELGMFVASTINTARETGQLARILTGAQTVFATLTRVAARVFDTLPDIFLALIPLGEQFAAKLELIATRFQAFIKTASDNGSLQDTLQTWSDRASTLMSILGNLGVALFNVFSIGADSSSDMFTSFDATTQKWREFTESLEGKNKIKEFFDNAKPVMHEVALLLGDIVRAFATPLVTGDTSGVVEFIRWLRVDVLPTLEELAAVAIKSGLGDNLKTLAGQILDFLSIGAQSGALGGFTTALSEVLGVLLKIAKMPVLGPVILGILGLASSIFAVNKVLLGFPSYLAKSFTQFLLIMKGAELKNATGFAQFLQYLSSPEVMAGLLTFAAVLAAVALAVGAFIVVWKNFDTINEALASAWEWFTKLNTPLQILIGSLAVFAALVLGPIALGAAGLYGLVAAIKNLDKIIGFLDRVWDAIYDFFVNLPDTIRRGVEKIPELLGKALDAFETFAKELPGKLLEGLEALGGFAAKLGGKISDLIFDALDSIADFSGTFGQWLLDQIVAGLKGLGSLASSIGNALLDAFERAVPFLARWAVRLPFEIVKFILEGVVAFLTLGVKILGTIVQGLVSALPVVAGFFIGLPFKIVGWILDNVPGLIASGIEIMTTIVSGLVTGLTKVLEFFSNLPETIISSIGSALTWLVDIGIDMITGLADGLKSALPALYNFFKDLPGNILSAIGSAAVWLFDLGVSALQGMLDGFTEGSGSLIDFFKDLPNKIIEGAGDAKDWLIDTGKAAMEGIKTGAENAWGDIKEFFEKLPKRIGDALGDIGPAIWDAMKTGFELVKTNISTWANSLFKIFYAVPIGAVLLLGKLGGLIWDAMSSGLPGVLVNIGLWVLSALAEFGKFMLQLPFTLLGFGASLVAAIVPGLASGLLAIVTWVPGALLAMAQFVLGLPATLLGFGVTLITGIATGLAEAALAITTWVAETLLQFTNWAIGVAPAVAGFAANLVTTIATALLEAATAILGWTVETLASFSTWAASIPGAIASFGANLLSNIASGLAEAVSAIATWASDATARFVTWVGTIPGAVAGFGANLIGNIASGLADAIAKIATWTIDATAKFVAWVGTIPGAVAGFGAALGSAITSGTVGALITISTWVTSALNKVGEFVTGLPGKLASFAGELASGVGTAIRKAWNAAKNSLPSLHVPLPFGLDFTIDPASAIPSLALGDIFKRKTLINVGEAGAEAVIPITRPVRALELLRKSGLDKLVLEDARSRGASDNAGAIAPVAPRGLTPPKPVPRNRADGRTDREFATAIAQEVGKVLRDYMKTA